MEIIVRPRGGGKTRALIAWAREKPNRTIICHSREGAAHVKFLAPDVQTMTMGGAERLRGTNVVYGIDNFDLLTRLPPQHLTIGAITLTGGDTIFLNVKGAK